jgi:hypothetical protein
MTGPPFQAAMELWAAARTDAELRTALQPAERKLGAELREVLSRFDPFAPSPTAAVTLESLLALMRGLEITRIMRDGQTLTNKIIDWWIDTSLTQPTP